MADRFYIGQVDGDGVNTSLRPYAIPDNAFSEMLNAYVFRGRVRKRFGGQLMQGTTTPISGLEQIQSRLKINIGTTNGAGTLAGTAPGSTWAIGQAFSCGNEFFTVYQANGDMLKTGSATTYTYNTATGAYNIVGSNANTVVYFYPATPVMGLISYEQPEVNDEQVVAFDTQFSYTFGANGWERLDTSATWSGGNADLFWGTNWRGLQSDNIYLFVSNNYYNTGTGVHDKIKYLASGTWTNLSPIINGIERVATARIIVPFQGRLLFLNVTQNSQGVQFSAPNNTNSTTGDFNQTVAGTYAIGQQFLVGNTVFTIASNAAGLQPMTVSSMAGIATPPTAQFNFATGNLVITGNGNNLNVPVYFFDGTTNSLLNYSNRAVWCQYGTPVTANAWVQVPGLGGFLDAPTKEAIVTAQFLKNRLIVFFESSTWELAYTGNQTSPFVWQKINTELGSESTFSQVPFDKVVFGVGNVGIHACTGNNVERIDSKIPQVVFQIHNSNEGPQRVYGIRDYYTEMVYWSMPDATRDSNFPFNNRVLTYNYTTDTWAFNNDSITCFGYFQAPTAATWGTGRTPWLTGTGSWGSATNLSEFRNVIAGNQEGYVFIVNAELASNCPSLQITNMTYVSGFTATLKVYNHNLAQNDYVKIINCQGVTSLNSGIFKVDSVTDNNTIVLNTFGTTITGTYTGGGTLTKVTPIEFKTKQFNFYAEQGRNAYISKVDFLVERTVAGQCVVDFLISSSDYPMLLQNNSQSMVGTSILETSPYALIPFESQQARLWHPVYFLAEGEYVQFYFYLNDAQIRNSSISEADFQLHAMIIHGTPTSSRLQ